MKEYMIQARWNNHPDRWMTARNPNVGFGFITPDKDKAIEKIRQYEANWEAYRERFKDVPVYPIEYRIASREITDWKGEEAETDLSSKIDEWKVKVLNSLEGGDGVDTLRMMKDIDKIIAETFDHDPVISD